MATYDSAIAWAQVHKPYQVNYILQLGKPRPTLDLPTAAVRALRDDSAEKWEFAYNPDFFSGLSDAEAVGVMIHEVYHIILEHLHELLAYHTEDPKPFENLKKMTIAQEYIVNDNVINDGNELPEGCFIGYEKMGFDTSSYTTKEVYDLMPDDEEGEDEGEGGQGHICSTGDLTEDELKGLVDAIKGVIKQTSDEDARKMSPVQDAKNAEATDMKKAGTSFDSSSTYAAKMDVSENWVNFIRKIHPDFLEKDGLFGRQRTTWAVPRKKFVHMYPRLLLPNKITKGDMLKRDGGSKPHIVLALDFSGSIPRSAADDMARLARSIPTSVDVDCCTFSTQFVPFDHTKDDNKTAGGGTDFSAVERFVRSLQGKEYPKAVVVFTDGGAYFDSYVRPTEKQLRDNWYWVAVSPHDEHYIKNNVRGIDHDKVFVLKDLF